MSLRKELREIIKIYVRVMALGLLESKGIWTKELVKKLQTMEDLIIGAVNDHK